MASKRRVKSKKKISLLMVLFVLLAIVAGVGAVVCMMMPFYDWSSSYTFGNNTYSVGYSISGFTLAWGGSIILKGSIPAVNDYSKAVDLENQNGGLIAIFCLFVIGLVLLVTYLVLSFIPKVNKNGLVKYVLPLLAFLCLLAGGIMCFCLLPLIKDQLDMSGVNKTINTLEKIGFKATDKLGSGSILSGICGIVSGVIALLLIPLTSKK